MGVRTEEGEGTTFLGLSQEFMIRTFLKAELSTVKDAAREELTPCLERCAETEDSPCSAATRIQAQRKPRAI